MVCTLVAHGTFLNQIVDEVHCILTLAGTILLALLGIQWRSLLQSTYRSSQVVISLIDHRLLQTVGILLQVDVALRAQNVLSSLTNANSTIPQYSIYI